MRRITLLFALLAVTLMASAQQLFVGSYNIRYHNNEDDRAGDVWSTRCRVICDELNFEDPDIFGAQEVLHAQLLDLLKGLDGYGYTGVGRDDGKEAGEYSAIFYKKDRVEMMRDGHFWLNETPDEPKLGWDAACIRICSWGQFRQKATGFEFYYFNLHMDHVGVVARREAAKLAVRKIKEIAQGAPVVLTGDFNVDQTDEIYSIFTQSGVLKDSYTAAARRFAENGTFNDFKPDMKTDSRIDHVFVSPEFDVSRYGILTNCYWTKETDSDATTQTAANAPQELKLQRYRRRLPSDHYPVLVKMTYKKENGKL